MKKLVLIIKDAKGINIVPYESNEILPTVKSNRINKDKIVEYTLIVISFGLIALFLSLFNNF